MEHLLENNPAANIEMVKRAAADIEPNNPILRDLMIAQAILESRLAGKPSTLALSYNNLFGIKGHGSHRPRSYINLPTKEYIHGWHERDCFFAWNETFRDSFIQHKELFDNGTSDNPGRYKKVLSAKTFSEAATEVQKGGYATDPSYTKKLIDIYNQYIRTSPGDVYE